MQLRTLVSGLAATGTLVVLFACGGNEAPAPAAAPAVAPPAAAKEAEAPPADLKAVAKAMVQAAMVKSGDKVLISGSVRDNDLLEDLAIETMKAGGQPLITIGSDQLTRRSYEEVPATYDSQPQTAALAVEGTFDVGLSVEAGESEKVLAGVPAARVAERAKAAKAVSDAILKKGMRSVNLGNDLYPTAALAEHLGKTKAEVTAVFWKAAMVPPETIRAKGEAMRTVLASAKQLTLTSANGTELKFGVAAEKGFVSDGAITAEKVKQGHAAVQTWLPAGELLLPVAPGTAEGKVVIDKFVFQGTMIEGLTLVFSKGKLTSMTAKSGSAELEALYAASGGGKDLLGYLDLGLNPEATLPTDAGRIVWMAPGAVTIGIGDNTAWGGANISNFSLACPVSGATLTAGGKALIENGTLK
jgi:leucyl aminopeptidase (aminopeptidase T)